MKIVSEPRVIIENSRSIFKYFAWPTVAKLKDGNLAVVTSGYRLRHVCPFGQTVISYSFDEGKRWTRPGAVIDTPLDDRDGGILVTDDKVIVTSFNNSTNFQLERLKDEEGPIANLIRARLDLVTEEDQDKYLGSTYVISRDGGYTFEDLKISPVTSPHGPCVTKDGKIIWVGVRKDGCKRGLPIYCAEMDENENFNIVCQIDTCVDEFGELASVEPHAWCMPDGSILAVIRAQRSPKSAGEGHYGKYTVFACRSYDGGHSFTKPEQILEDNAGAPPHLLTLSSGKVILTYSRRDGNKGIRAVVSEDSGKTFGEEIKLTENAPVWDLGYVSSAELSNGDIISVYYENDGECGKIKQIIWSLY